VLDLSVSRHPVLRAYDQCLAEGSIVGQAGSGTSVAAARSDVTRSTLEALDMTHEDAVGKIFADLSRVEHTLISAGILRNAAIVRNDLATLQCEGALRDSSESRDDPYQERR
jgi:DNA-binding FadR family transcriptional regulator